MESDTLDCELTLNDWLLAVDRLCLEFLGIDRDSLTDWGWAEAFGDGMTPRDACIAMYDDLYGDNFEELMEEGAPI